MQSQLPAMDVPRLDVECLAQPQPAEIDQRQRREEAQLFDLCEHPPHLLTREHHGECLGVLRLDVSKHAPVRHAEHLDEEGTQSCTCLAQRLRRIGARIDQMQKVVPHALLTQRGRITSRPLRQQTNHANISLHRARREALELEMTDKADEGRIRD